jgi:hypothetical protein
MMIGPFARRLLAPRRLRLFLLAAHFVLFCWLIVRAA